MIPQFKLHTQCIKSLEPDNIQKLCLWMPKKRLLNIDILTCCTGGLEPRLKKSKFLFLCTQSLEYDNIEIFG